METPEKFVLELTRDEALVLFEWLASHEGALPVNDAAEQEVLWRVEAALERGLAEPFRPDYKAILAAAKERLRESE